MVTTWMEGFSVPVHYTATQSRVPLLDCTLTTTSPEEMTISREVDLAPLLLKPLQLVDINLPLTSMAMGGPYLRVRGLFVAKSSPQDKASLLRERLRCPPSTYPSTMPSGKLHVQFLSLTKLRRTFMDVSEPVVGMELVVSGEDEPSDPSSRRLEFNGTMPSYGEYAIYFESAEGTIALPSSKHTTLMRVWLRDKAKSEGGSNDDGGGSDYNCVAVLTLPVLPCMVMEGHVLEGCFPLRTHLGHTKVGDLRLSIQYVPDELVFSQPQSSSLGVLGSGDVRDYRIKVCSLRGVYDPSFPGRKDPYVEVAVVQSRNENERSEEDCYSMAATTIAGDASEQAHWNEVVDLKVPPPSDKPWIIRVRLKTAAVMKDEGREDLLGQAYLPWPPTGTHNPGGTSYQLTHPTSSTTVAYINLAFLGPVSSDTSTAQPGYEAAVLGGNDHQPPPMSPDWTRVPW